MLLCTCGYAGAPACDADTCEAVICAVQALLLPPLLLKRIARTAALSISCPTLCSPCCKCTPPPAATLASPTTNPLTNPCMAAPAALPPPQQHLAWHHLPHASLSWRPCGRRHNRAQPNLPRHILPFFWPSSVSNHWRHLIS